MTVSATPGSAADQVLNGINGGYLGPWYRTFTETNGEFHYRRAGNMNYYMARYVAEGRSQ